jgi:hypothetical protein
MKKMKRLGEALKVSVPSSAKISCACRREPFVGKDGKGLVSMAEFQTQKCYSVCGAVVNEKAMRIRTDLKTVLHNDPGNPQILILGLANPNIEVGYLSSTSTSLL